MVLVLTSSLKSRAAEARLGFMTRYPNAYSTPSHANHIKAVEDNLNSAKLAQREVKDLLKSKHCISLRLLGRLPVSLPMMSNTCIYQ